MLDGPFLWLEKPLDTPFEGHHRVDPTRRGLPLLGCTRRIALRGPWACAHVRQRVRRLETHDDAARTIDETEIGLEILQEHHL